jgi:RHS repeat-associated protein
VQADRFTLYVHEAPNFDGAHATESVSYVVLEAGNWTLADGTRLEVGTVDTAATVGGNLTNVWEHVGFASAFRDAPVVISQVQTNNDTHWVKTRQQGVTPAGFDVALEEDDAQTTPHGIETIGWLAIEPGTGMWSGHKYEAAKTADAVTQDWYTISFSQSFSQAPRFVAGVATYDGGDGAYLRYDRTSLTASGVQVMIEEDTTYDSETDHTTEVVHYLAIEGSGTLTATAVSGTPGGLGYYDRDYAYDEVGNITHKDGMGDYFYDDPDHIHAVTRIGSDQRYWYDDNGNMTTRVVLSGTERITYTQAFNAENKLAVVTNTVAGEITTFVYDGNGVRVKKIDPDGSVTYYVGGIYEVFYPTGGGSADAGDAVNPGLHAALSAMLGGGPEPGELPTVVPADPGLLLMVPALGMLMVLGRRRRRYGYTRTRRTLAWSVGSVLLVVAIVGILAWFTAMPTLAAASVLVAGPEVTKYYYAGMQRVAMRKNGTVFYLHGDHLGSTSLATDAGGAKASRVLYYPYGEERYWEGTLPTDFTYTGQRSEGPGLGGLMDYRARFYDPSLGRFISADTIVPNPSNPQDLNRFAYARNNP